MGERGRLVGREMRGLVPRCLLPVLRTGEPSDSLPVSPRITFWRSSRTDCSSTRRDLTSAARRSSFAISLGLDQLSPSRIQTLVHPRDRVGLGCSSNRSTRRSTLYRSGRRGRCRCRDRRRRGSSRASGIALATSRSSARATRRTFRCSVAAADRLLVGGVGYHGARGGGGCGSCGRWAYINAGCVPYTMSDLSALVARELSERELQAVEQK